MLSSDGNAKLGDFDFADRRHQGDITTLCPLWGSPGYISPERLQNGGEDHRGDIYSLGITIYELLSGQLPFGIHGTPEELYRKRENMEFAPLSSVAEGIPDDFSVLISSVLSFNMESRPGYSEIISGLSKLSESSGKESGLRWTDKIANIFKRSGRKGEQQ
jgi:serine/threonine-protein kinase